jgi:hypothetical protein
VSSKSRDVTEVLESSGLKRWTKWQGQSRYPKEPRCIRRVLTLAGRKLVITSLIFWVGGALLVEGVAEPAAIVGLPEALPRCEHVENRARYS